jgi:transposase
MPNRVRVLTVPDADRAELERRARSKGAPARVVERARIVLLAADGLTGAQIAERAGCTEPTVIKWRRQYAQAGLAGLEDASRPGGPKTVLTDAAVCEILAATVTPPPESLQAQGVTHWPGRRLADWLRQTRKITVSHDSISRLWRKFCLQPHRTEGFKFSAGRLLEAKIRDVVGPVPGAARERGRGLRGRELPDPGARPDQARAADAARHSRAADPRLPAAACPGQDLHVVCGNYATHKHADVRTWLRRPENQRITLHFVPTSCSWLNLVECFGPG